MTKEQALKALHKKCKENKIGWHAPGAMSVISNYKKEKRDRLRGKESANVE